MNRAGTLELARNTGSLEAQRALQRLNLDQTSPIDVFRVIQDEGLWLFFQPMDGPLGAYLRTGSGSGILINTKRPRSVQRLTAAHEYGHHVLGHEASIDDQRDINNFKSARVIREAAAQAFATDFLMPPQLINHLWNELRLPRAPKLPDARQVYLLSLYLGASYTATIHQLVSLQRLVPNYATDLLRTQPRAIKRDIGSGIGPQDPGADVWPLAIEDNGRTLQLRVSDELSLCLPEQPSTGYVWTLEEPTVLDRRDEAIQPSLLLFSPTEVRGNGEAAEGAMALKGDGYESADRSVTTHVGSEGNRYLSLVSLQPGRCRLRLALRRPWQTKAEPLRRFEVDLMVEPKPTGDAESGPASTLKAGLAIRQKA